jgi:hypothetical protein
MTSVVKELDESNREIEVVEDSRKSAGNGPARYSSHSHIYT